MTVIVWILVIYSANGGVTSVDNIATAQSCAIARDLVKQEWSTRSAICVPVRRKATEAAS